MTFEIKVLKTPGCKSCEKSLDTINKVEEDYDIDVETIDLTENPEMAQKYDIMAAPGIIINGEKEFQGGIKEKELRKKLERFND